MTFSPARRYIRHTADVSIEVDTVQGPHARTPALNVSEGGLSFRSDIDIPVGSTIVVRIPEVHPPFEAHARVAWAHAEDGAWTLGVQFLDPGDAYRARMVEQVCAIDQYHRQVQEEGRAISRDEAAREWIEKYARRFPGG